MLRMFTYGAIGLVIGFIVILALLTVSCEPIREEYSLFAVLALMGALPAASGGILVGAVKSIQDEFREMRREMKSMQTSFYQTGEKLDKPSTQ
jgi:hypothetical protein